MKRCGRSSGMTLIEVLLAVSIISLGMVVLLTGSSRCLAAVKQARYYQKAQWIFSIGEAEHPLVYTNDLAAMEVAAVVYDDAFTFSRRVEEDDDEDGLVAIKTRVTWSSRGQQSFEEVTRLAYLPDEEAP